MNTQTLNLEKHEVVILILSLYAMLTDLEENYKEGENDNNFLKKEALSEINNLKTLIEKVDKLKV